MPLISRLMIKGLSRCHSRLLIPFCLVMAGVSAAGCAATAVTADPVYFPSPPAQAHVVHLKSFNALGDLIPRRGRLRDIFRGRPVSPHVGTPSGIAYRDGALYVCDTHQNVVHAWDLTSGEARRIGGGGDVVLAKPVDVAVDAAGVCYVADTERAEVVAYDARGGPVGRYAPPGTERFKPTAVAVHGSTLYVADIAAHRIEVFSRADGGHLATVGEVGSGSGHFYFPTGVATDGAGNLFVSDMMNGRVQVFDHTYRFLSSMGQPGSRYGDMAKPRHLAVGPDGVVFIADVGFAHVHLFNMQGQLLMLLGGPEDQPGGTPMPVGVAVAVTLPEHLTRLVPADFDAHYYLFVTNSIGRKRISLFAIGTGR